MADAIVQQVGTVTRVRLYVSEVMAELKRVTWPDKAQVRQLSIGVVLLSLFVGAVIAIIDIILQNILIKWLPTLFS